MKGGYMLCRTDVAFHLKTSSMSASSAVRSMPFSRSGFLAYAPIPFKPRIRSGCRYTLRPSITRQFKEKCSNTVLFDTFTSCRYIGNVARMLMWRSAEYESSFRDLCSNTKTNSPVHLILLSYAPQSIEIVATSRNYVNIVYLGLEASVSGSYFFPMA